LLNNLNNGDSYYQADPTKAAAGIIDPSKIDPVAQAYFAAAPDTYFAFRDTVSAGAGHRHYNEYLGKIDYNISSGTC